MNCVCKFLRSYFCHKILRPTNLHVTNWCHMSTHTASGNFRGSKVSLPSSLNCAIPQYGDAVILNTWKFHTHFHSPKMCCICSSTYIVYPGFMRTLPKWMVALKCSSSTGFSRSCSTHIITIQTVWWTESSRDVPSLPLTLRQTWSEHQLHQEPSQDNSPKTHD
jgi:hypothetical protein